MTDIRITHPPGRLGADHEDRFRLRATRDLRAGVLPSWLVVTVVPRHRLDFVPPADPAFFVCFGFEGSRGFWAELRTRDQAQPVAAYGAFEAEYRPDRPWLGLLEWLAQVGAFSASALEEALAARASPERVRLSRDAKRALRAIEKLKAEADW